MIKLSGPGVGFSSALVTGATGFIGSRLVERLLELSAPRSNPVEVITLVRRKKEQLRRREKTPGASTAILADPRVVFVEGDLTVPGSLKFSEANADGTRNIDVVYHLAAVTPDSRPNREMQRRVNLDGTKNLFEAVRGRAKRFVYASGLAVFEPAEGNAGRVVNEESKKIADYEYVKIRLEAEDYLRQNCEKNGIDFTVLYFPDIVYGSAGTFRRVFLEQISKGKFRIPGSGDYHVNLIHLDDAVNILISAGSMREAANESFIASDSEPAPFRDFVNSIADGLGVKHPGTVPLFLAKAAVGSDLIKMLTRNVRASNNKIKGIYRFQYPSYRTGIPEVISKFNASQ